MREHKPQKLGEPKKRSEKKTRKILLENENIPKNLEELVAEYFEGKEIPIKNDILNSVIPKIADALSHESGFFNTVYPINPDRLYNKEHWINHFKFYEEEKGLTLDEYIILLEIIGSFVSEEGIKEAIRNAINEMKKSKVETAKKEGMNAVHTKVDKVREKEFENLLKKYKNKKTITRDEFKTMFEEFNKFFKEYFDGKYEEYAGISIKLGGYLDTTLALKDPRYIRDKKKKEEIEALIHSIEQINNAIEGNKEEIINLGEKFYESYQNELKKIKEIKKESLVEAYEKLVSFLKETIGVEENTTVRILFGSSPYHNPIRLFYTYFLNITTEKIFSEDEIDRIKNILYRQIMHDFYWHVLIG